MIFVGGIDAVESYGIRHTTGKIVTFAAQSLSHGLRRDSSLYTREPLSRFCQQCDKSEFTYLLKEIDKNVFIKKLVSGPFFKLVYALPAPFLHSGQTPWKMMS